MTCYICLESRLATVASPCNCRGRYVHIRCLQQWRAVQNEEARNQCSVCHTQFGEVRLHYSVIVCNYCTAFWSRPCVLSSLYILLLLGIGIGVNYRTCRADTVNEAWYVFGLGLIGGLVIWTQASVSYYCGWKSFAVRLCRHISGPSILILIPVLMILAHIVGSFFLFWQYRCESGPSIITLLIGMIRIGAAVIVLLCLADIIKVILLAVMWCFCSGINVQTTAPLPPPLPSSDDVPRHSRRSQKRRRSTPGMEPGLPHE